MPIYEFRCTQCGHVFEKIFTSSEEQVDLVCPECDATSVDRVVSVTNYAMGTGPQGKQAKLDTKTCGPGNTCSTLELPGHSR